ncbi:helix-turn-helix domain-containing protein [Streptomyces ureilyticus]|uniref:Helix-turn-helix domain-containing protein n=1 Tax=Streptomyces ureilyticus TaxID=1775131 RepID=A0ABX0DPJ3_9ACTN|nr:helix-turn-helix domain-containing protein [Streptomyces ureilyticus]NGO43797.1 helix-turn-helix domain-containing protein [Streptomyces ureilyticus]
MSRILYPVKEAAQQLGMSVSYTRDLIMSGRLRSVKIGHARRVPADALHEYVQRLDAEQNGDGVGAATPTPSVEASNAIRL